MVRRYVEALGASLDVTIVVVEAAGEVAGQRTLKPFFVHEEQSDD